ncbi:MAG: protein kinase, partial [Rhizobium sp.]|nr:protein kinase [Rhizobium sp.]
PQNVEVVTQEAIPYLKDIVSWEGTRTELEKVGKLDNRRSLGREAATVWRVHRDIQLAIDSLRNFPVKLSQEYGSDSLNYIMELDEDGFRRMNERGQHSFLRQVILEGRKPRAFFADSVATMAEDASRGRVGFRIYPQASNGKRSPALTASVILPVDGERVRVRFDEGQSNQPLQKARIVWLDSMGTKIAANRQSEATTRLERKSWLMDYLVTPRDCGTLMPPISDDCGIMLDASEERIGELAARVQVMLASDPLHAVQGPPGTGKTTLISALAAEVVRGQDGARMLVTSQSHAATDNVVLAVMSAINKVAQRADNEDVSDVTAIRLFSDQTADNVDPEVRRRYSIDSQVREVRDRMRESAERQTATAVPGSSLDEAIKRLKKASTDGYLEIRSKIERSAPLVFSTTGAAMTATDYLRRGALSYDYALIDEAAKAWAIDLIQPMSVADRAILVGDQAQLPPFGEVELDRLLRNAQRRRGEFTIPSDIDFLLDTSRMTEGEESPFDRMKGWLKLFHRLFEKRQPPPAHLVDKGIPLTQSLNRQFRSVAAIGKLVSDTFYRGSVISDGPEPDPSRRIGIRLAHSGGAFAPAVVWIDTSAIANTRFYTKSAGAGIMRNEGEADIVKQLLGWFRPEGGSDPWERLRVLSPYKAQVQALTNLYYARAHTLGVEAVNLPRLFQTVDASQGSEADVVVISICRRFHQPQASEPATADSTEAKKEALKRRIDSVLGFLQQPERLNVMMSRARHQLILVGDFEYFRAGAELLSEYRRIHAPGSPDAPVFWEKLQSTFAPFDPAIHLTADGLERPVILPARMVLPAQTLLEAGR